MLMNKSLATGNEYTNAIQQKFINEKIILICADIEINFPHSIEMKKRIL